MASQSIPIDELTSFIYNKDLTGVKLKTSSTIYSKYEHIGYTQEEVDKIYNEIVDDIDSRGYMTYSTASNNFLSRWNSTSMGTNTYLTLGSNPTRDMHAATKQYVDNAVGAVAGLSFMGPYNSFEDLPAQGDRSKIYLVSVASSEANNIYEEYIYINNSYELIGTTEVDLSDYLQSSDVVYTQYYQALTDANSNIKTGTLTVGSNSYDLYSGGEVGHTNSSTIMLPRYTKWIKTSAVGDKLWTDSFIFYTTNAASINSAGKIGSKASTVVALDTTTSVGENSIYVGKISGGRLFCARLSGGSDANWNVSQGIANGLRDYVTVGANSFDSVGNFSTIEGTQNSAKGSNSHTEGLGNNATRAYMHVFGTYNVDPASGATSDFDTKGTYVEIVGNGTANSARHNARTLDWSGNEWLAGKLTVSTNPTNNMDVATKQYVDNAGTTHMVKEVDYVTAGQKADTTLGTKATAEGNNTTASGVYSHAEGENTTASNKYSHAEGYNATASGEGSHAEGIHTTSTGYRSHAEGGTSLASGSNSHAEGYSTEAIGASSHAEGVDGVASGDSSHAEGFHTTASGSQSHAEGYYATASSASSHAEGGNTIASGDRSHAEGENTTASGMNSHTEGYGTTAQRKSQHVFGEWNVLDVSGTTTTRGTYVEIVGNGTTDSVRSNARTLDWDGNETLAGKLTVGVDPVNNMDVTTKQYVDNNLPNILKFYYTTTSSSDTYIPDTRLPYKVDLPSDWENLVVPSIRYGGSLFPVDHIDIILQSSEVGEGEMWKYNSSGSKQAVTGTISYYSLYIPNMNSLLIDSTDGSIIYRTVL